MENQTIDGSELRQLIVEKIDKGDAIILLYNSGGADGEGHYIVVTGYIISGSSMTVYYNDPAYEGDEIGKSASKDDMKSKLPGTSYNYNSAYSVRNNLERIDNQ